MRGGEPQTASAPHSMAGYAKSALDDHRKQRGAGIPTHASAI
jgi:hypothetical protein